MSRNNLLIIGGIVLGTVGAFFLGRQTAAAKGAEEDIDKEKEKLLDEDPTLSEDEATAAAAAALANAALLAAQQAEEDARLDQLALILSGTERDLAGAQEDAILHPDDPEVVNRAEELEALAITEREELKREWTNSLNAVTVELQVAERAAEIATESAVAAMKKVVAQEATIEGIKAKIPPLEAEIVELKMKITVLEKEIAEYYSGGYWIWERDEVEKRKTLIAQYEARINGLLLPLISKFQGQIDEARDVLESLRQIESRTWDNANMAITATNLIVERALTITADVRLLGILFDLAHRTDRIAIGVRNKLGQLQALIE